MKDIRHIAQNLGKTGMPTKKIADVLEEEVLLVETWLEEGGVDPRDYRDAAYQRQMASLPQKPGASNLDVPKWKCRIILGGSF